jgi:hypothetical protein
MSALIVAVDMAGGFERLGERAIDAAEKAGCMQDNDRRTVTAPIEIMQADAVDGEVTAAGCTERGFSGHRGE